MIHKKLSQGSNQVWAGTPANPTGQYQSFVGLASCPPLKLREAELKITYRNLPHWELEGSVYFITFNTWEKLELTTAARQVVLNCCQFFDRQRYQIFCFVVMPDHVHMLMQPLAKSDGKLWSLSSILHSIKSYSANSQGDEAYWYCLAG